jgi:hypothetical protein
MLFYEMPSIERLASEPWDSCTPIQLEILEKDEFSPTPNSSISADVESKFMGRYYIKHVIMKELK